ncbi:MAG: polyphosphate polymerase domain-containing protein [Aeromicrobium sp.]
MSRLALALEQAQAVSLDGLNATARLLTRRDRKYIIPIDDAARLVETLSSDARVLTIDGLRTFRYESVYFDTPDLQSFLGAARRRPRRFKVRTRSYVDSGRCVLEIKTRGPRGRNVKERHDYSRDLEDQLDEIGMRFVSSCPLVGEDGARLRPVLQTRYERSTLVLAEGVRVTIDLGLEASTPNGLDLHLMGMAVVETKSRGPVSSADRDLWAMGHRPLRISKFGTSMSVMHPELPSNKWTRALARPWIVSRHRAHA